MEFSMSIPKLDEWYDFQLARIYDEVPARRGDGFLVMGCPIWGEEYVREFLNWCVPTIMEAESAAALKGRCRLVVCTPAADWRTLLRHLHTLDRAGIELQFIEIPEEVLELARKHPQHKLFLLGTAQKLVLQVARRLGAAFHMPMPDHVHGAGYFARIDDLRRGRDAIVQCGISAAREPAQAELQRFRTADQTLSVPAVELGGIAWRHMHHHHRANVMAPAHPDASTIPDAMPRTQLMLWRTRDRFVAHSCRPNPVWLSSSLVGQVSIDLQRPATLDCEVPVLTRAVAGGQCYLPTATDGLAAVELSPAGAKNVDANRVPFAAFAERAWNELRYSDIYLDLLKRRGEYALPDDPSVTVTDEEIAADVERVSELLLEHRPPIVLNLMQRIASAPETLETD